MTDALSAEIRRLIGEVDERGGAVAAINQGFQKAEIERSAYAVATEIESGDRQVIGVNAYREDAEEPYRGLRVDPELERGQRAKLAALRARRDNSLVTTHLAELAEAARGTANVLLPMRAALQAEATVGEVCGVLREVWGTYQPNVN
jgi:methylmalonyl-CoA mutase N-terminal domain/subunit